MSKIDATAQRLKRGLRHPINAYATIIMSLYTFMWGLWLATPAWATFGTAPLYSKMDDVGPEWLWGLIAVISGLVMLYGVLKPSYGSLSKAAFTGAIHWGIITFFYFWGDWHSTGGLTALMIAVYCSFVYLNLRVNRDNVTYER